MEREEIVKHGSEGIPVSALESRVCTISELTPGFFVLLVGGVTVRF
jgi:hypothetical protein